MTPEQAQLLRTIADGTRMALEVLAHNKTTQEDTRRSLLDASDAISVALHNCYKRDDQV